MSIKSRIQAWLGIQPVKPLDPVKLALRAFPKLPPRKDKYRHALQMPSHPPLPADLPDETQNALAMDDMGGFPGPNWEWGNAAGVAPFGLYFPGYQFLSELAQRTEYRQPAESYAKEATRKWIEWKSKGATDKAEKIQEIEDEVERFKIQDHMRKLIMHDCLFGGGFLYIDIKGQENARRDPLIIDEKTIPVGSLNGFAVIEPIWVTPIWWNSVDPTQPDYYKPTKWSVLGRETHAQRLMTFFSREVPDYIKPAYNFLGISLSQLINPYVDRWLTAVTSVSRLISNFSTINLQTELAAVLSGDSGEGFLKRMEDFLEKRDNQGLFITDKDREALQQLSVSLASLDQLQAQAQEHMAMPTHIPLVVLTGVTPSGLNASSKDEIEVWNNWIHGYQEGFFTDHMMSIRNLIMLNKWGAIDEDIIFDYVLLKEVDGEAQSRIRKTSSDAGVAYINAGVIEAQEERERIARDPDSGYNSLDINKVIAPPLDPDQDDDEDQDDETTED